MHEVLKSGGIDITERSLRTFLDKGVLPGRKVAKAAMVCFSNQPAFRSMVSEEGSDSSRLLSRTEVHVALSMFAKQGSGVRRMAVRRGGFRDASTRIMKLHLGVGDGRAHIQRGARPALPSNQRPRTAMARSVNGERGWRRDRRRSIRCHRSKNEEPPASVSSHGWRWREAPRHGLFL